MLSQLRCDGILIRCKLYSKRQPEVPVTPSGGKELHCTLWRRLFDACLVALESISPGQRIYYGTLRCHTLPSKENFPIMAVTTSVVFATDFSLTCTVPHFPSHQGAWPELPVTALNILIKIPSHLNRESILDSNFELSAVLEKSGLVLTLQLKRQYRRTGFNCENLIIANYKFSRVRKVLFANLFY